VWPAAACVGALTAPLPVGLVVDIRLGATLASAACGLSDWMPRVLASGSASSGAFLAGWRSARQSASSRCASRGRFGGFLPASFFVFLVASFLAGAFFATTLVFCAGNGVTGSKVTSKLMASGSGGGADCQPSITARCNAALAPMPAQ
jgi:hypothetical protein